MDLLDDFAARGILASVTDRDGLGRLLAQHKPVSLYAGFDPTSPSLQFGNLVTAMLLYRFQQAGHRPVVLVGGATGMIGDPSGRSDERNLLDEETLAVNVAGIRDQLSKFLDFGAGPTGAVMANNYDWFKGVEYLVFLRDVGKHLTVNYMLGKDSVRSRLDSESGISYAEFSYMLLQGWDFVQLFQRQGCRLQVGGNDQYGNITAGCELGRKMGGVPQLYGLCAPLLLDATGQKMGKTSTGERIWLDPARTSPYAFYQFLLNQSDDKVPEMLRMFSFRPLAEVEATLAAHDADRAKRIAQRALAEEMTRWVHGEDGLRRAEAATQVMFGGSLEQLGDADLEPLVAEVGCVELPASELGGGISLVDLLVRAELTQSKGEARRLIGQGGVYVNNVRVAEADRKVDDRDRGTQSFVFLRSGKKKYRLVRVV